MRAYYAYKNSTPIARETEQALDSLRTINGEVLIRNLLAIVFNWSVIFFAIFIIFKSDHHPLAILVVVLVTGARQHALLILMHDASHFNLCSNRQVNNLLADIFCAWPHLLTTASYRLDHLAHHQHVNDPLLDPNMIEKVGKDDWNFPMPKRKLVIIFLKDLTYAGPLRIIKTLLNYFKNSQKKVARADKEISVEPRAMLFWRLIYYISIFAIFIALDANPLMLLYWFVPMLTVLPALLRARILCEHHNLGLAPGVAKDDYNQSRHYALRGVAGSVQLFFLSPHHVANHQAHHFFPSVPWFRLPELSSQLLNSKICQK